MQLLSFRWESHVSVAGKMSLEEDFSISENMKPRGRRGQARRACPQLETFREQVVCLPFESVSRKHMHPIASTGGACGKNFVFCLAFDRSIP
jgi:hypothetical protein